MTADKRPYLDIDCDQILVQEAAPGSIFAKSIILRRGQHLSAYELDVAERHGLPIRWE